MIDVLAFDGDVVAFDGNIHIRGKKSKEKEDKEDESFPAEYETAEPRLLVCRIRRGHTEGFAKSMAFDR